LEEFRTRKDEVAKRLDIFLVSENLMDLGIRFQASVEEGGISDHRPISLLWKDRSEAPPAPMKINQVWLADADFRSMVSANWVKLSSSNPESMMD
jgi:hypothetical protein